MLIEFEIDMVCHNYCIFFLITEHLTLVFFFSWFFISINQLFMYRLCFSSYHANILHLIKQTLFELKLILWFHSICLISSYQIGKHYNKKYSSMQSQSHKILEKQLISHYHHNEMKWNLYKKRDIKRY